MSILSLLRYLNLLIHICAGIFWLGWMVFIFILLTPVLKGQLSSSPDKILDPLKQRIRKFVFWIIWIIVVTGTVNVYFTGLYKPDILLGTAYGHRFLVKLGAASVLFSVYALAPRLTGLRSEDDCSQKMQTNSKNDRIVKILHIVAFASGLVAAFIGLTL